MTRVPEEKLELLGKGNLLMLRWCYRNGVEAPLFRAHDEAKPPYGSYGACAYYRNGIIHIWPAACAAIGRAGRQWSYPGYVVDRTPYGVLCHELGHHVEGAHGARGGSLAPEWSRLTGEPPLTSYAPNDNEWFAEIFRLFVTNPGLLRLLRPRCYALLTERWPCQAEHRPWEEVLDGADRQMKAARNKIAKVR